MGCKRVARYASDDGAGLQELRIEIAKLLAFGRAPRRVVARVEIQDDRMASLVGEAERAVRRFDLKVVDGFHRCLPGIRRLASIMCPCGQESIPPASRSA